MKNKKLTKWGLVLIEALIMAIIRVVQVLSINNVGAVTAAWATVTLWILAILTFLSVILFNDEKLSKEPNTHLSLGAGIAAFALGAAIVATSAVQYANRVGMKFALPTLIVGGCASLSLLFVVSPVNIFPKKDIYTTAVKGLSSITVLWLGFVLIGVFFLNKTSSLTVLNAFSILGYSAYVFFFLAYIKLFCGFEEDNTHKRLYRWGLLSAAFLVCNIATKIAYFYITHENAVSDPYAFGIVGILLDFSMLAFALCNIIKIKE